MSRTKRGEKGPGYDYWSRRPYSSNYGYGPDIKKLCHRKERVQSDIIIAKEIDELIINSMVCPVCELNIEDCECYDIDI